MPSDQASERLSDNQVRERLVEMWPKVQDRHARLAMPWIPEPVSALAEDDASALFTPWPSALARTSVSIATEHFLVASTWLLNFGPAVFSIHTLLRTALIGGAQTVWMLSPVDRGTRLERAASVSRDAYWNHHMWVKGLVDPRPEAFDVDRIDEVGGTLAELVGGQRRPELNYTQMIATSVDHIYSSPPDPSVRTEALATWRILSCVAHALPWEMNTRAESTSVERDGVRTTETRSSWADLQAALSLGWALIDVGWQLLDERGQRSVSG